MVDDLLQTGAPSLVNKIILFIQENLELGTIVPGPALLRHPSMNIRQHEYFSTSVDGDDKLDSVDTISLC